MHSYQERQHYAYSPEQLFDLIINVENYPSFLPWCEAVRITSRDEEDFTADMVIRFKGFREQYTSRVRYVRPSAENQDGYIIVEAISGPFAHLKNSWNFQADSATASGTLLGFHIEFQFKNKLMDAVMGMMFESAQKKLLGAFAEQAEKMYGKAA